MPVFMNIQPYIYTPLINRYFSIISALLSFTHIYSTYNNYITINMHKYTIKLLKNTKSNTFKCFT